MTAALYVDTSALAKWYVNEVRSDEFDAFIRREKHAAISRLTVVELRCLLTRKRRAKQIDGRTENRVLQTFESDIRTSYLTVYPLEDSHAITASDFLTRLKPRPLRTLDALHLAIARGLGAKRVATADRVMAAAATALGMDAVRFD